MFRTKALPTTRTLLKSALPAALLIAFSNPTLAAPEPYSIDTKGAHAFIQFKIKHLGYSWLYGRFNDFDGRMMIDEANPANSSIQMTVNVASLDSNHAERDKHLRGKDFLNVKQYPTATFISKKIELTGKESALLTGDLKLHGVTKSIQIPINYVGGGKDPWGGYRHGFTGSTTLTLKDFGINKDLGPASTQVELLLDIEAIKK